MKAQRSQESPGLFQTDGGKTKSNAIEVPAIELPKGGGAVKGIDEKFSVNAVNGTASFSIPLPQASARGAVPSLSLSYNSGSGNGVFGLGWSLSSPSIKRKTDKGLPRYMDAIESDTYLFSEAEDLVPEFKKDTDGSFLQDPEGEYMFHENDSPDGLYIIRRYRPRIDGLFSRIERWSAKNSGEIKWRIISKENITTLFGWTAESRIADPNHEHRVYEWLPEFMFDDKGNCAHYRYKPEDSTGLDITRLHNRNRLQGGNITYTNRYPEKIFCGNKTAYQNFGDAFPAEDDYLFSTVFDYGEYDLASPYAKTGDCIFRPDAFSDYKPGFEIRTTRLCRRVMLFHHFTGTNEYEGLVKSANFEYNTSAEEDFTFLESYTLYGYIKKTDGTYSHQHLPPATFTYQTHDWNKTVSSIHTDELVHAPVGLDEKSYQFTDLYNEGLSGILTEQANGWYYKHNLGGGSFAHAKLVTPKPSFTGLGNALQLADLDADGGKQLVNYNTDPKGYFEKNGDDEWLLYRPFESLPNINFNHPDTKLIDLNGDGIAEVLIAEENGFTWYPAQGRKGFTAAQKTARPFDEEAGPHVVFSDTVQSIFMADMCGDGLTDIVRIKNGEVCYWPNLGYGKFGAKVALDQAPVFDHPDAFNPTYIRLADIDGSGTTDIIYLGKNKFSCWKNLSGNRFANTPFEIDPFPEIHALSKVTVTDLLGNGVACIVWSSPLAKDGQAPLKYIDLMNGKKPHLMVSYQNSMGKEVRWEYTPSTHFYLQDRLTGQPWVTKLHFPVHCVSKTETVDHISGYRFVSAYSYHHGYYDHAEREFRGFGRVEQTDSETFEHWVKGNASNIVEEPLHQEPVLVKSWKHTGAFLGKEKILTQFAHEYWHQEIERQGFPVTHAEMALPDARLTVAPGLDPALLDHLSAQEWREALRACKGMNLRMETFAKDALKFGNTDEARKQELIPYTAASANCVIELLQPKGKNKYAVFVSKESEAITYSYERDAEDPRVAHKLNLELDEYGNVLEMASVVYPRVGAEADLPAACKQAQQKTTIIYTKTQYTNDVETADIHRLRLASETKTFELKGVPKANTLYVPDDFTDVLSDAVSDTAHYHEIEKAPAGKPLKRCTEHIRSTFYNNALTGALPLHQLESLAIPHESFQLAYSPELLTNIFGAKATDALMTEGRFTHSEGDLQWWVRSGLVLYLQGAETQVQAKNRFFAPMGYTDAFGATTRVSYYGSYFLFLEEAEDALGNKTGVEKFNFRTLTPQRMKDVNGNRSEAISNELGLIKAMALFGKGNEADELTGLQEETDAAEIALTTNFFNSSDSVTLTTLANTLLQRATTRFVYDFEAYLNTGKPVVVANIQREEHYQKNNDSALQFAFEYTNGLSQVVMKKEQAEPGIAKQVTVNPDDSISISTVDTGAANPKRLRWVGNGRVIKNNKGNPVKQYEPYFSVTPAYENTKELVETGETPKLYYDALGRLVKTEMPDATLSRVEIEAWKQKIYDTNDTILESDWYTDRSLRLIDAELLAAGKDPVKEQQAANEAAKHANTPNVLYMDTLGKPVLSVDHTKNITTDADEFLYTQLNLDSEGNLRSVTDARQNTVMEYKYDMLGQVVYQKSGDAGQRWLLTNISGKPLRTWDERNHEFQYFYDTVQRPVQSLVLGGDGAVPLNHIVNRLFYGESLLTANRSNESTLQAKNVLGQAIQQYDTGGLLETPEFDFKGSPVFVTRKLFKKYKEIANWTDANLLPDLETESFTFTTEVDAMGRIRKQTAPDGSIITPAYNEAGLLDSESVLHPGDAMPTAYIKNIDYNEKGHREKIIYGNDVMTSLHYDKKTFRLNRLESKRNGGEPLQDWYYTYDPIGNITHLEDKNIPVVFFDNTKVAGVSEYTYDALYRLVQAKGRENDAGLAHDSKDNWNDAPYLQFLNPGDAMAVRNYTQNYTYDEAGNLRQMKHTAPGNSWTRDYAYALQNNRLSTTQVDGTIYTYPHHAAHGYMVQMPHLDDMGWNFMEELVKTVRQKRNDGGTPETTYYQYDGKGQRIRKITENEADPGNTPTQKEERIYISGYEVYRKHSGADAGLERSSLSLQDDGHRFVMVETRNLIDDGTEKRLVRYQMHNHLGSAALELDHTGRVISYEEYHPFGTTAYQANNASVKSAAKRYRYTGMERDEETGLEYHNARYYVPWLGRWLNADPTGLKDGTNLYRYSQNNPIRLHDRSGTQASGWTDFGGNELTVEELRNVRVFIFHNDDFSGQALDAYRRSVAEFGEGSAVFSNTGTNEGFSRAWGNMAGSDIASVMIMTHGKNQSINLGNNDQNVQFTATGNGLTNISGSAVPNLQDLPQPSGDISQATLYLYTCHSADTQAEPHGSGDHVQGALAGSMQTVAEVFAGTFNFDVVVGTVDSVNYHGGWVNPYVPYPVDGVWLLYEGTENVDNMTPVESETELYTPYEEELPVCIEQAEEVCTEEPVYFEEPLYTANVTPEPLFSEPTMTYNVPSETAVPSSPVVDLPQSENGVMPDPSGYGSYDEFHDAVTGPYNDEAIMERWASVHGWSSSAQ